MHLAAFVDDVAAADRHLTIHPAGPLPEVQGDIARALPEVPIQVTSRRSRTGAQVVRDGTGRLAIALGPNVETALVLDGTLAAVDTIPTSQTGPLAGIDESTVELDAPTETVLEAAAEGVASVVEDGPESRLHMSVNTADTIGRRDWQTSLRVYDHESQDPSGELENAHLALATGSGEGGAAFVAVPEPDGQLQGFVTLRSALVADIEAYLERAYGDGRARAVSASRM
ncbi:MAG: hypothetical protein ABEH64_05235 [Salinirussus sp.]